MSSVSPTNQDLSNDTTFSQIKSRVPVPLKGLAQWMKMVKSLIFTKKCSINFPKHTEELSKSVKSSFIQFTFSLVRLALFLSERYIHTHTTIYHMAWSIYSEKRETHTQGPRGRYKTVRFNGPAGYRYRYLPVPKYSTCTYVCRLQYWVWSSDPCQILRLRGRIFGRSHGVPCE